MLIISWRSISPISKPYFVKKSSNGEFLCLNAHNCTLESKDVQVHSFVDFQGYKSRSPGQIFETIQYAFCHRKFSYMINQKFMKLCTLQDPNMKMCTLVGYPSPLRFNHISWRKVQMVNFYVWMRITAH
jgi:hypothetical protein